MLIKESIRFEILTAINTDNTSFMLTVCLLNHAAPQEIKPNRLMPPLYSQRVTISLAWVNEKILSQDEEAHIGMGTEEREEKGLTHRQRETERERERERERKKERERGNHEAKSFRGKKIASRKAFL